LQLSDNINCLETHHSLLLLYSYSAFTWGRYTSDRSLAKTECLQLGL